MKWWGLAISLGTFVVGTLFPAYKSVEALESSGTLDDSQWLTYWLLSSFLTIIERFGYRVLFKMPLYGECKLALLCWLALPMFNGASLIYKNCRPYLMDFYSALRQTGDEIKQEPGDDQRLIDLRKRMTNTRANVAQALLDMYNAVRNQTLDPERLKSKLDELESTMDLSSGKATATSTSSGAGFASGNADLLSGGGGTGGGGMGGGGTGGGGTSGMGGMSGGGMSSGMGGGDTSSGFVSNIDSAAQPYNTSSGTGTGSTY